MSICGQLQTAYKDAVARFLVLRRIKFFVVGQWADKMFEGMDEVQALRRGQVPHPAYYLKGLASNEAFSVLKITLGQMFSEVLELDRPVDGPDLTRVTITRGSIWDDARYFQAMFALWDLNLPLRLIPKEKMSKFMKMTVNGGKADKKVQGKVIAAFQDVCREGGRKGGRNNPKAWINDMQFEHLVQVRFLLTFPPKLYTNTRLALPRSVLLIGAYLAK